MSIDPPPEQNLSPMTRVWRGGWLLFRLDPRCLAVFGETRQSAMVSFVPLLFLCLVLGVLSWIAQLLSVGSVDGENFFVMLLGLLVQVLIPPVIMTYVCPMMGRQEFYPRWVSATNSGQSFALLLLFCSMPFLFVIDLVLMTNASMGAILTFNFTVLAALFVYTVILLVFMTCQTLRISKWAAIGIVLLSFGAQAVVLGGVTQAGVVIARMLA